MRVCVKRLIQHEAKPSAVFASRHPRVLYFSYTQARWCFKCYIVLPSRVWLGAIFSSTQTAGHKDISKCLTNLFLVVEQTNRISLVSFSHLQCHARDQSCCHVSKLRDQMISKCLYLLYSRVDMYCQAMNRIHLIEPIWLITATF